MYARMTEFTDHLQYCPSPTELALLSFYARLQLFPI